MPAFRDCAPLRTNGEGIAPTRCGRPLRPPSLGLRASSTPIGRDRSNKRQGRNTSPAVFRRMFHSPSPWLVVCPGFFLWGDDNTLGGGGNQRAHSGRGPATTGPSQRGAVGLGPPLHPAL